jgi:hypothetical protein
MDDFILPHRKISGGPLGTADMTDGNDAPNVKIIPPLVYLAGIVIGFAPLSGCRPRSFPIR